MDAVREFELVSRGFASLVDRWKVDHDALRPVWQTEDLISAYLQCSQLALAIYDDFRRQPAPQSAAGFGHFLAVLEDILSAARLVEAHAEKLEQSYRVKDLDKLRDAIHALADIIDEERWPAAASIDGGALDDWK